jgi:putative ABC transport system permease protein
MAALILRMLRERRLQAFTLTAIAAIAFAAAFGLPAYVSAVDATSIRTEFAHASVAQRLVEMVDQVKAKGGPAQAGTFGVVVPANMASSSLSPVYAAETDIFVLGPVNVAPVPTLEYRQDACAHVVMVAGRCAVGNGEVMVDAALAKAARVGVGGTVPIAYADIQPSLGQLSISRVAGYGPMTVSVVGIYRPRDANEPFWGEQPQFQADSDRNADAPVLTSGTTFAALPKQALVQYVDAVLQPSAVTPARVAAAAAAVKRAQGVTYAQDAPPDSGIPEVLTKIAQDRAAARQFLPIVVLPLIGLGWLVVYLASAYTIIGRREELGVISLRGSRFVDRWRIGIGESVLAVLLAIPIGYLIALAVTWASTRFLLPHGVGVPEVGPGSLRYVLATLAGCLLAVVVSAWRPLRSSTAELLRGVPPRLARWRTASMEIIVVIAAAVLVQQDRGKTGPLSLLDEITPALAIAAVAVVAARLVVPLANQLGRRGIRQGRRGLGLGLGALQVARRPGVARLFTLMVITVGLATYAAAGASVSTVARSDRASQELGAATVLSVGSVSQTDLLADVKKADPSGRYAMAAAYVPSSRDQPSVLAVDSSRLASVAVWPTRGITVQRAVSLLRPPPAGKSIIATGAIFSADIDASYSGGGSATPAVAFSATPLNGGPSQQIAFNRSAPTSHSFVAYAPCSSGCRIDSLTITDPDTAGSTLTVTIGALRSTGAHGATVAGFTGSDSWIGVFDALTNRRPAVNGVAAGLAVVVEPDPNGVNAQLLSADSPAQVPILSTGIDPGTSVGTIGPDAVGLPVRLAGKVPSLPGMPDGGMMVDLQSADRAVPTNDGVVADQPQVWLSASAPADMPARLRSAGLSIVSSVQRASLVRYLAQQAPAVAASFAVLAAAGALLMTIGAAILTSSVDRRRRGAEMRALRVQGLPERSVRTAARFAYVGIGVVATVVGLVAGLISWRLTGLKQPMLPDARTVAGLSPWPSVGGVLGWWLVAAIVVLVVSGAVAWDLRRHVRHMFAVRSDSGR